tara:strand:+ start:1443 stop:2375 length:933 start_codon:yes stop_codon:yes gene_type:complete
MKQNSNSRRSRQNNKANGTQNRNKNNGKNRQNKNQQHGAHAVNRQVDSHGPAGKVRGTAKQLYEKYKTLAREHQSTDSFLAEAFYQHADHYYRIYAEYAAAEAAAEAAREKERQRRAEEAAEHQATLASMANVESGASGAVQGNGQNNGLTTMEVNGATVEASAPTESKPVRKGRKTSTRNKNTPSAQTPSPEALMLDLEGREKPQKAPRAEEDVAADDISSSSAGASAGSTAPTGPETETKAQNNETPPVQEVKKRRGRPPKAKTAPEAATETSDATPQLTAEDAAKPKRTVRRSRKKTEASEEQAISE